jgi:uncharacterized repeat protein (TIGR01451 family)
MALAALLAWAESARPNPCKGSAEPQVRPPLQGLGIYTSSVTLSTYPYAACLEPAQTGMAGVSYRPLDWSCLSRAGPPVSQTYELLVLSNDYLSVTLLPELGGRVYELVFKPSGHNELYRNPVLKPAPFGSPEQGWWMAVGGLEWGFPTDEHGYRWGVPWSYRVFTSTAGVTVTLSDSDAVTHPTVSVAVHLPRDRAALVIQPQLRNPTDYEFGVKYWTNAMLAPGAANAPSASLRWLFAGRQVTVHSAGDADLPPEGQLMDWPLHNGRDYSLLGNWNRWLGFFEAPQAHGPFAGVYDAAADEGVLRVYPANVAQGSKGFAFGWQDPLPSSLWTDDGSAYVELHGGLEPTFWDTATLAPGQVLSWTEVWYPLAGIGGVSAANAEAALRLERVGSTLALGLYTPAAHQDVDLYLWSDDCASLGHWKLEQVDPVRPVAFDVPAGGREPAELSLAAIADNALLGGVNARDCVPPLAAIEPLPFYTTSPTFSVAWSGEDAWSGVAGYDVGFRVGITGRWNAWLTNTLALSSSFVGADGQTYFFRVRARDQAGNVGAFQARAFSSVLLTPAPVLTTWRKQAAPLRPALGQAVSYTVLVSNTGNLTASSLVLSDHLPATLALVSGTLEAGGSSLLLPERTIVWRGELPPGQELRLTYALTATPATSLGARLTNTAWLVAEQVAPSSRQAAIAYYRRVYLALLSRNSLVP